MFEIIGFFLIGLTGGFGHCVLMCHPFVLYISSKYVGSKTGYGLLYPHIYYNLGRIVTYTALGAVAGFFGSVVQYAGTFVNFQKTASIIGGIVLIFYAVFSLFHIKFSLSFFSKFNSLFGKLSLSNPFFTGLLLGFLPCGLSMGAVIGAASTGSVLSGALSLTAFGLGTSVALLLVAVFGSMAMKYSSKLKFASVILLFFMGIYFIYSGVRYSL